MKTEDNSDVTVTLAQDPAPEELTLIERELAAFGEGRTEPRNVHPLAVLIRDRNGTTVGGLRAITVWRWLEVKLLWVPEDFRRCGIGRRLMETAETEAIARGCHSAWLDTSTFHQALPFYAALGYSRFGELRDFPPGETRFFLSKTLATL